MATFKKFSTVDLANGEDEEIQTDSQRDRDDVQEEMDRVGLLAVASNELAYGGAESDSLVDGIVSLSCVEERERKLAKVVIFFIALICSMFLLGGVSNKPMPGGASQNASLDDLLVANGPMVVPKSTFWENSRVLFVVGLKETGHDLFESAIADVCRGDDVECVRLCALSSVRWTLAMEFVIYERMLGDVKIELEAARARYDSEGSTKKMVFLVNLWGHCDKPTCSMTLPISEHELDLGTTVDVRAHALVADQLNVDMRMLVLVDRNLTRTTQRWLDGYQHSRYSPTTYFVLRTIQGSYEALWTHLNLVDSRFWAAFDTGDSFSAIPKDGIDLDLDEWTGLPGLQAALESHKNDEHKPTVLNPKRPYGGKLSIQPDDAEFLKKRVAASHNAFLEYIEWGSTTPVVEKTVFRKGDSRPPRVLFLAGLEGTGHHLFQEAFTKMTHIDENVVGHCKIQYTMFQMDSHQSIGECQESPVCLTARERLFTQLEELGSDPTAKGKTYIINTLDRKGSGCHKIVGQQSYPNFGGYHKQHQVSDLVVLAQAAEAAGVDLQIVMLDRRADAIIKSVTVHRHFGARREIRMLEVGAYALRQQLGLIDPAFLVDCVDLSDPTHSWMQRLEGTLEMPFVKALDKVFDGSIKRKKGRGRDKQKNIREHRIQTLDAMTTDLAMLCPLNRQ